MTSSTRRRRSDAGERSISRNPLQWPRALADWLCGNRKDYRAFQARKASVRHRGCRRLCIWLWIGAGVVMALWPEVPVILSMALATTFLCFTLMDGR